MTFSINYQASAPTLLGALLPSTTKENYIRKT